jgi:PPOX class probable F420-dependent enzyme
LTIDRVTEETRMADEDAFEFVRTNHRAVLATRRRDGGFQLSPVLAVPDAEGRVVISTREAAMKTRNLRRDPRAALCVLNERFFGEWHSLEGTVEVLSLPAAMEPLVDYYRRAVGEHPDWADYRQAMERERRVLLRLTVERSGPTLAG